MSRRETSDKLTRSLRGSGPSQPEAVIIEAVAGPGKGARTELAAGLVVVGSRASACDLLIQDEAVSRKHASLELLPGQVRVRDLGSRNGTVYLGARITEVTVPVGATLRVGQTTLRIAPAQDARFALSERQELGGLVGRSPAMRRLFAVIEKLGPSEMTVLIQGETGTGKELVARALHVLSARAKGPFCVFDCASASAELVESQLFGHRKGAFTGALKDAPGAIAAAERGTLLLAGVGDLPLSLQPKLLRFLESREYQPIGAPTPQKASVRVLAKTHRNLEDEAKAGHFRSDLFFRLAASIIQVPALRERPEDIPALAAAFARELTGVDVKLARATLAALQCESWPGNVRELRNAVARAVALGHPLDDPQGEAVAATFKEARAQLVDRFERDYLTALLADTDGNVAEAARRAALSREGIYQLLRKHRIRAKGA